MINRKIHVEAGGCLLQHDSIAESSNRSSLQYYHALLNKYYVKTPYSMFCFRKIYCIIKQIWEHWNISCLSYRLDVDAATVAVTAAAADYSLSDDKTDNVHRRYM